MTLSLSFFETTIRYLGGMLSAYELNGYQDASLLANAQRLADKLIFAWVPANGPIPFVPYVMDMPIPSYLSEASDTGASILTTTRRTSARLR